MIFWQYTYVPVLNWWVDWEPSHLFLVLSLFVFANYFGLMLSEPKADKVQLWQTAIKKFLFGVLV